PGLPGQDKEGGLESVLRVVLIAQDRPADAQDHRAMTLDQGGECEFGCIPAPGYEACEQLPIGQSRDRACSEHGLDEPDDGAVLAICHGSGPPEYPQCLSVCNGTSEVAQSHFSEIAIGRPLDPGNPTCGTLGLRRRFLPDHRRADRADCTTPIDRRECS